MATREEFIRVTSVIDLDKRWKKLKACVEDIGKVLEDLNKEGAIFNLQGIPQACDYLGSSQKLIYAAYEGEESVAKNYE